MAMSPYLRSIRARIGNDLIVLPSVAAMVLDERRRVLLVRDAYSGDWSSPGGAVDPDENPADAAVREAFEETGYEVELIRVLGVYGGPGYRLTYANGDVVSYVSIAFEARVTGGRARPDGEETSEVGWFTEDELRIMPLTIWGREMSADLLAGHPAARFPVPHWRSAEAPR
jgi:ADP-ribose pyrophosphatase YjhB (NUDIX family)